MSDNDRQKLSGSMDASVSIQGEKCIGYRDPPDPNTVMEDAIILFRLMDQHHPGWRRITGSRGLDRQNEPDAHTEMAVRRLAQSMCLLDIDVFNDAVKGDG